jgi:hypothetical protein
MRNAAEQRNCNQAMNDEQRRNHRPPRRAFDFLHGVGWSAAVQA